MTLNKLIAQGLDIQNNTPAYHFTMLNHITPKMVKEATTSARIPANKFAASANVTLGGSTDAHHGGFMIHDVVEKYSDDTKTVEQEVGLVTAITFYLTE